MNVSQNFSDFLTKLRARINYSELAGSVIRESVSDQRVLDEYVGALVREYAGTNHKVRHKIELLLQDDDALWYVIKWITNLSDRMKSPESLVEQKFALVATCLIGERLSPGDLVCLLGGVYTASRRVKVENPLAEFKEVAECAVLWGHEAVAKAMRNFEKSEVYRIHKGIDP